MGIDVGGTFTDAIFQDGATGAVYVAKEPTTPDAPERGVMAAVRQIADETALGSTAYFLHATTVGLNSLLERSGGGVGLLSTRGFTDILEVRRGASDEPFNPFWKPSPPLVPRRLRLPVTERIRFDGTILTPLDELDIEKALATFNDENVTSIAVCFLHSYANPAHELGARDLLHRLGYTGDVSLSHEISGEYREFERTSTTVVDAYVRPRTSTYLRRLRSDLEREGFNGDSLMTRCGGGSITFAEAERRPFETITSGPVAGAEGAAELARVYDLGDVITADVGGTSFDTCLIVDGRPRILYEGAVASLPIQTPWVDVRSVGAGGGSIAYVDVGGLLQVGPRSAGADPGPVCYRRGGEEPTVTDAALILGMLGQRTHVSGVPLDVDLARDALAKVGAQLDLAPEDVARGVITIAASSMADAIREVTIEQGDDPRGATLMAFGGAGPLFSTLLARELEISSIVVPPYPGNFSAWGLLGSDLTRTSARTTIMQLSERALRDADEVLNELFTALRSRIPNEAADDGTIEEAAFDMRYAGQEHAITVPVPREDGRVATTAHELGVLFEERYERAFRHTMEETTEIVATRATLRTSLPRRTSAGATEVEPRPVIADVAEAYSLAESRWMRFDVCEREALQRGAEVVGPSILLEATATTYLDAGFTARVHDSGALFISVTGEAL
jgi:N-methylhydantoinase A